MADRQQSLLRQLDALERPGLAKTLPQSLRERCEDRGSAAYSAGFEASAVPEAEMSRRVGVDRRVIRDWRSGARAVPLWAVLTLPREGRLAAIRVLLDAEELEEDEADSARGAA